MADQQQNDDSKALTDIELERLKMFQDSFKHMMTFCSGAIVLSAAVTGALFPKPDFLWSLGVSVVLFALGTLFATVGLAAVGVHMNSAVDHRSESLRTLPWYYSFLVPLLASVLAAYVGLALFSLFALVNVAP